MSPMQDLTDPRIAAAVHGYFEHLNAGRESQWMDLFADDAVIHQPVGSMPAEGPDGLREVWNMLTRPFSWLELSEEATFYAGSGAAVKWKGRGHGVTGGEASFEGIIVFEIAATGKIQTLMAYWDPAAALIQLADTESSGPH